jgi:hypothetical protein
MYIQIGSVLSLFGAYLVQGGCLRCLWMEAKKLYLQHILIFAKI